MIPWPTAKPRTGSKAAESRSPRSLAPFAPPRCGFWRRIAFPQGLDRERPFVLLSIAMVAAATLASRHAHAIMAGGPGPAVYNAPVGEAPSGGEKAEEAPCGHKGG
jgi:hypothetical protein